MLAADGVTVAGAAVSLVEAGLSTTTAADGRYTIGVAAPGTYTLTAQSGALVKTVTVTIPLPSGSLPGGYDVQLGTTPPSSR